jgi:hypothetical protein
MSAPLERITAFHAGPFVGLFVGTMEVGSNCAQFVRADLYDAAIAAARAEGVREGMLRAAEISDEKAEHLRKCNFKPGGFGPLGGWVGVASDVADRIRAAAEAQP